MGNCLGWSKFLMGARALWNRKDWHKKASTVDCSLKQSRRTWVFRLAW